MSDRTFIRLTIDCCSTVKYSEGGVAVFGLSTLFVATMDAALSFACSSITNDKINVVVTGCDSVMMLITLGKYQLVRWGLQIGVLMHLHVDSIWNGVHLP